MNPQENIRPASAGSGSQTAPKWMDWLILTSMLVVGWMAGRTPVERWLLTAFAAGHDRLIVVAAALFALGSFVVAIVIGTRAGLAYYKWSETGRPLHVVPSLLLRIMVMMIAITLWWQFLGVSFQIHDRFGRNPQTVRQYLQRYY